MSGQQKAEDETLLKRVPVIVRSWDGPNSRIGLEVDLGTIPWGPFDALGKRLSLLVPSDRDRDPDRSTAESQVERALRHVEHAADRCAEFAQISNGNQELWLRSHKTWEWIRQYLTSLWVEAEVDGGSSPSLLDMGSEPDHSRQKDREVPSLPGAASTLLMAARALRATPLAVWRETMGPPDLQAPTREEAVQTLLGVARILGAENRGEVEAGSGSLQSTQGEAEPGGSGPDSADARTESSHGETRTSGGAGRSPSDSSPAHPSAEVEYQDPDQVSFDFAKGYDEGYRMGRRVGLALGAMKNPEDQGSTQ